MEFIRAALFLSYCFAVVLLARGASVQRYESAKPAQTTVIDLLKALNEGRNDVKAQVEYDDTEYFDEGLSGDYDVELPRVAFSVKPKDLSTASITENKGKSKKERGKKRNPCLRKYKDFCIHGVCQYLRELRTPSCICMAGYSGERCHLFSLPVAKEGGKYNRTTALAVMAVVLSSLCLIIIGILLGLRYHSRGAYNVEMEEKVKLGLASLN